MTPRLYVYKLTVDNGGAPCVHGGLLTLAICKPKIRTTAEVGDILFGFAAKSLSHDNRLIYIARVTAVEVDGDYYEKTAYEHRDDRIYIRGDDGRFRTRPDARHHADGSWTHHDVGSFPDYERARVLVSNDFRYFGSAAGSRKADLSPYPRLRSLLRTTLRGHGVNHSTELEDDLRQLLESAWSNHLTPTVGSPSQSRCSTASPPRQSSRANPSCG